MNTTPMSKPSMSGGDAILKAYGVLTALSAIKNTTFTDSQKPVLINDVLAYVKGRTTKHTERVELQLTTNLNIRRQYQQLLKLNRVEHIAKPRAAHSDGVFEIRVGEHGVLLKLKQSKGNANQFYLIIEMSESVNVEANKVLVLHANTTTQTQRAVFPPLHDVRSQMIIQKDELLFALLQDHDVEIDIQ